MEGKECIFFEVASALEKVNDEQKFFCYDCPTHILWIYDQRVGKFVYFMSAIGCKL